MTTQPGITMPKNLTSGNGGDQQPPRHTLTGFSFEENEPEQHTHAFTTTSDEHGSIEPNLVKMTTEELYAFVNKTIASLHLYDWNPEEGWTPTSWKEALS